jgi:tRNA dimethylallyltransferase
MKAAILIHGPTASGKTALAVALARELGGEIVNADAMQVYDDLRILSARPGPEDRGAVPHHLFGHIDAADRYSAGRWVREAAAVIRDISDRGGVPIIAGGTGLYLQLLTTGISAIPDIPEAIRRRAREMAEADAAGARVWLGGHDPETADKIEAGDRQRLARAIEVVLATGRPISAFHGPAAPELRHGEWLGVALTPVREHLYERIDRRVDAMIADGAVEEARRLWSRALDRDLPAMRAHGVPGFCDLFDGAGALEDAIERCKRDTRRYAKRQMTWISHQFTRWIRVPSENPAVRKRVICALYAEIDR